MATWIKTGTVSVTLNSTAVNGVGTKFLDECRTGDGFVGPDRGFYEVLNIVNNTQLTLGRPYLGATAANQAYAVVPVQGYLQRAADELRAYANTAAALIQSPTLNGLAAAVMAANQMLVATGAGSFSALTTTAYGRALLNLANQAALQAAVGAQASSANLTAFAALPMTANGVPYMASTTAMAVQASTAYGRSLWNAANAAGAKSILALGNAADATLTVGNNDFTAGRITTVGDYGWGGNAGMAAPNNNADDIAMGGVYSVNGSTAGVPAGYASGSSLLHVPWSSGGASHQMIFAYNGTGLAWRRRHATTGWADWNIAFSSSSVVPVANGGTGGTTQAAARTGIGALGVGDYGIGLTGVGNTDIAGLDTMNSNQLFASSAGGSWGSGSGGIYPMGFNIHRSSDVRAQFAISYGLKSPGQNLGGAYYRNTTGSGVWAPWAKLLEKNDVVGTVSQTAGAMTGAIIERGANANGEYVRFADGTQIVWKYNATASSIAIGATGTLAVTYPMAFAASSAITQSATCSPFQNNDHYGVIGTANNSASGVIFVIRNGAAVAQQFSVSYMAIGRWY